MPKTKEKKPSKKVQKKAPWIQRSLLFIVKILIATFFTLAVFAIYLDAKIRDTFEGQRWNVPVQVYGQLQLLTLGDYENIGEIAQSLVLKGYKKVRHVTAEGQFSQSSNRLIIFQKPFDSPDGLHNAKQLTITIVNGRVFRLKVNGKKVKSLTLAPQLLARLVPSNKEDRILIGLEAVPAQLIDTLLLVEDRDFYNHQGLSPIGIFRALYQNIRAGRTVQGGSTLTQQLAKNMFLSRERTFVRKVKEALMALILEMRYSKDQLLEAYINEVYLGQNYANGVYGFGLAAKFYFGKAINQLSVEQIALLIAQVKGPSYYDPWRHPKRAIARRDLILRLMFEQHFLSLVEFEKAAEAALGIRSVRRLANKNYPAYLQLVNKELNQHISVATKKSGVKVFTGFSHRSQQLIEQSVAQQLPLLERKYQQKGLEAAVVVTDITSGEIRALLGGRESGYAGFNRALNAKRQIGSLLKPIIYATALEQSKNYNFATLIEDKAITLKNTAGKQWQPKNYDGKYRGKVSLIEALVQSLNVPTINLGMNLGLESVALMMKSLGYQHSLPIRPSVLLGALNMSPLEANQLYLPIANNGHVQQGHAITHIIAANSEVLWQKNHVNTTGMSANTSFLVNDALMRVTQQGTARSLSWRLSSKKTAGKTGTSNDLRDSWYVGYDNKHLVTTWIGKDNNTPTGLTGSSGALVLFADFMKRQGVVNKVNKKPEGIFVTLFERDTGNAVTADCQNTVMYPAVKKNTQTVLGCLKNKVDHRSWFEKVFGG
jgi:penicillin-binding protein 1B